MKWHLEHKGHRNLFVRGLASLGNALLTGCVLGHGIDIPHQSLFFVFQLASASTLLIQWRTARPSMFLWRGCSSLLMAIISFHLSVCGQRWPGDGCVDVAWTDIRQVFRILHVFNSLQLVLNGLSCFLQYRYPHRMFASHGNEQLFYRGCIQATGVPINMLRGILKISMLTGTKYERLPFEVAVNFLRAFVTIPFSSGSLFNQWWYTQKGSTGHPTSDAHERLFDPEIDCPIERVQVSIMEAHGLRKADLLSDSDPFCICEVLGRPESAWRTACKQNTHDPVWNEIQELVLYRKHDSLVFSIYDYDGRFCCISERSDFLGKATLKSEQFHPAGFDGVLQLEHAGKNQQATVKVRVKLLDFDGSTVPDTIQFGMEIDADPLPKAEEDLANSGS
mmetsp:Transcript_90534/g.174297  ORF Transcript_90534/g.174297 Transcript_90534/m.174297 type:complete len:392 (+) Transcript_90534:70-1245(+)